MQVDPHGWLAMPRTSQQWMSTVLLLLAVFLLGLLFVPITQPAYASDSLQSAATVNLQYFTIGVQYPAVVLPGANIVVYVQAVAKSAATINSLAANVYYGDGQNLHQLTSATLLSSQTVATGNTFMNNIPITIPEGILPTSLFATFTESVKMTYPNAYSYNSYYYNNGYYCGYSNYYMSDCYDYPSYYYPYTQYSYVTTTDTGVSPLSYVNATTPQYTNLQSQSQNLQQQLTQAQTQNQNLTQKVNQQSQEISQLQTQVQQLQQSLQNQQNALSQKDSANSNLAAQLTSAGITGHIVTYLAIGFGVIAVLAIVIGHRGNAPKKTQSVNPYAANYVPSQTKPDEKP